MSTVEAAASLFGSDGNSGPDPFAVIGNEETDTTPATGLAVHEHGQQTSPSHLYSMGQDASSLFGAEDLPSKNFQEDSWSAQPALGYSSDYSQPSGAEASSYDRPQEWNTESIHVNAYDQVPVPTTQPVQEVHNSYSVPSSSYDPYTPASNASAYQPPSVHQYSTPQYTPAQSAYDPYKPTGNTSSAYMPYQPPAPSHPQPAYDQYKPPPTSVTHSYTAPSYAAAPMPPPPSIPAAQPVPPPVSAAVYRPKTSNAYDPPLPPPKVSKRAVSARAPGSVSPAIGHQTYLPPNQYAPAMTSPPPPPPSSISPQYAHNSASNQGASPHHQPYSYTPNGYPEAIGQHEWNSQTRQPNGATWGGLRGETSYDGGHAPPRATHSPQHIPPATPPQPFSNPELQEEAPTPRPTPSGAYDDEVHANGILQVQHSYSPSQPEESQESGISSSLARDEMSWDDPEGGLFEGSPSSLNQPGNSYFPHQPGRDDMPSYKSSSPAPIGNTARGGEPNGFGSPPSSPPSSPLKAAQYRQDSVLANGRASPRPTSVHSRTGSLGSNTSSHRGPVPRVSSPLRGNIVDSTGQGSYSPNISAKPVNPYDPSPYAPAVPRTTSPSSVRSLNVQQAAGGPHVTATSAVPHSAPHNVRSHAGVERTVSPIAARSQQGSPAPDHYAPPKASQSHIPSNLRGRSSSNGSTFSAGSGSLDIPSKRGDYGGLSSRYPSEPGSYGSVSAYPIAQEIYMSPPARPPYAPSPSLVGANDPLGRTSSRAPIISFGFGGKVITCFHDAADLMTGFDVALSSRRSTDIQVRVLHKVLPEAVLESSSATYPGPLLSDPGTPVTGLVRTGASAQVKTKKSRVIKYLEERSEEISRGVSYISDGVEKQHLEDKLALVKLLKVLVENDGVLSGSAQIDAAVRAAIIPRLSSPAEPNQDGASNLSPPSFTSPIPNAYGLNSAVSSINEAPIAVSTLLPSALDKIQEFLIRGERRQAYHFALDEKLWAHAMVIASSIDKEAWKEVVQEFLKTELGSQESVKRGTTLRGQERVSSPTNSREWLRVAYSLFSGQGPAAVKELVPTNLLSRTAGTLQVPAPPMPHITPMSPNFPAPAVTAQIPPDSLSKWPEIVATIVSSPLTAECSATLTALGDYLVSHNFVEAAHACYLLSPQTSSMGGVGSPSTRIILVGSRNPHSWPVFTKDPDPIIFSEITEFAFSLKPSVKGQEPFHGFPHLQAYKMIRASYLSEMGHVQAATRYCEAISGSMGRPSPYFNAVLSDQLKGLADRLIGVSHVGKAGAWIGGKMSKPSLDSIGNWLEGRLTEFIAGGRDDPSPPPVEPSRNQQSAFAGPFSTISSATNSASPSPPPTMTNLHSMSGNAPPRRSGSAMAITSTQAHVPIDRASSAMEYYRPARNSSPAPQQPYVNSASTSTYSPYVQIGNGHAAPNGYASAYANDTLPRKPSLEITAEEGPNQEESGSGSGWWNSLNSADSASTPTAATFHQVNDYQPSSEGFISLMDDPALSVTPSPPASQHRQPSHDDEDDDDLGLGNSTKRDRSEAKMEDEGVPSSSPTETAKTQDTPEVRPPAAPPAAASGSWLSRFWKRGDAQPGPVKASLGEETSFYYDKELKRWVNKKAGAEDVKPAAPPPPPSRAQTASPGRTAGLPAAPGPTPPPPRSASAIDLTNSPPNKPPMRVRSNLVPAEFSSMPNTPASASMPSTPPPSASLGGPPPPGRPRSQAAKRNVRSRYVDVFQQETGA